MDIPAYDDTIIEARKADAAKVRQEFAEAEARRHQQAADAVLLRKRKLALRMKL